MRVARVEVSVDVDDAVSPQTVADMIRLHMAMCFNETREGNINWRGLRVRIRNSVDTATWDWESPTNGNG